MDFFKSILCAKTRNSDWLRTYFHSIHKSLKNKLLFQKTWLRRFTLRYKMECLDTLINCIFQILYNFKFIDRVIHWTVCSSINLKKKLKFMCHDKFWPLITQFLLNTVNTNMTTNKVSKGIWPTLLNILLLCILRL